MIRKHKEMEIHPQSLLNIPLIDFVIKQKNAPILARPVESKWTYKGIFPISAAGFNPFCGKLFCAENSVFNRWLPQAHESAIPFNNGEWLVYECFFVVHDYLHLWAISEMLEDLPYLKTAEVILDEKTISDLEFLYIVSEAAATVCLDFWYLAKTDINTLCPINSHFKGLTSVYQEADLNNYQQYNKDFEVQSPSFFQWIVNGYCSGEFEGFSVDDLKENKKLSDWLGKEVTIAHKQVWFIRHWLHYLAGLDEPDEAAISDPIKIDTSERESIISRLGDKLWKIAQGELLPEMRPFNINIKSDVAGNKLDFRFINMLSLDNWEQLTERNYDDVSVQQFAYFAAQYLSAFQFDETGQISRKMVEEIIASKDTGRLKKLTNKLIPIKNGEIGPGDLVFVN